MTEASSIRRQLRDIVEYLIASQYQFVRQLPFGRSKDAGDARWATSVRFALAAAPFFFLLDAVSGSWFLRRGMLAVFELFGLLALSVWLFNRWLGIDENRAILRAVPSPSKLDRRVDLAFSAWIILPLALGSAWISGDVARDQSIGELQPVYALLRAGENVDALRLLQPMVREEYWTSEQLALFSLVELRMGDYSGPREHMEAAVRNARTSHSRACGSYQQWIDRRSCANYVQQVKVHDPILAMELERRFCATLGDEFPGPDPTSAELSGCGVPAPYRW